MNLFTVLLIAVGLAMDSFSVSITSGLTAEHLDFVDIFKIAFFFSSFQAFMPLIGWTAGVNIINLISGIDHWIAFGLLSLIGCRMIYEAAGREEEKRMMNPLDTHVLLILSIATSIDALAVGLSLSLLKIYILTPAAIIGIVTFSFSFLGVLIGERYGAILKRKIEGLGGLILIGLGVKILIEHIT